MRKRKNIVGNNQNKSKQQKSSDNKYSVPEARFNLNQFNLNLSISRENLNNNTVTGMTASVSSSHQDGKNTLLKPGVYEDALAGLLALNQTDDKYESKEDEAFESGLKYYYGEKGVKKNWEEALKYFQKAAKTNPKAQFYLSSCGKFGDTLATNQLTEETEAVKLFRLEAKKNQPYACHVLGMCYEHGYEGVVKDEKEAVNYYRLAAESGCDEAQLNLGFCYLEGIGVQKDTQLALEYFNKSATAGNESAQFNLGICYLKGLGGIEPNQVLAGKWIQSAANSGHTVAKFILGGMYLQGSSGFQRDDKSGIRWIHSAAQDGLKEAQFHLGNYYKQGKYGLRRSPHRAGYYHKAATERGYLDASACLNNISQPANSQEQQSSHPVSQEIKGNDDVQSISQFIVESQLNNVEDLTSAQSQYQSGLRYKWGHGVAKDAQEAVKWFYLAASQGHCDAQCDLGICYEWGIGIEQNAAEAEKWFRLAAGNGSVAAINHLESLVNQNTLLSPPSTPSISANSQSIISSNTALFTNLSLLIPRANPNKVNKNTEHTCESNP